QQLWCTYALHIATFTSLAFVFNFFILAALWRGIKCWNPVYRKFALYAQLAFLGFFKVVKLLGLIRRYPSDVVYVPVSILFGYFHGLIKIYTGLTLYKV
ncbi:Type 2 glycosyltransferase, partial [Pyricularia oryzae]